MEIVEHTFKVSKPYTSRNKTTEIIMHCSATPQDKDFTVDDINRWHNQQNYNGIGYNFVIYRDGTIHRGRPEDSTGAHCVNHNSNSIGICYIGGCDADGKKAKDTRTDEQKQSQYELIEYLLDKYKLTINNVHGHRDYAAKDCPSYDSQKFRDEYLKWKDDKYEKELDEQHHNVPVFKFCKITNWFK